MEEGEKKGKKQGRAKGRDVKRKGGAPAVKDVQEEVKQEGP